MPNNTFVGQVMDGYELVEELGAGGMATVYKAFQQALGRWVALKLLHLQERTSLLRFQREARAIANLRHRNILTIYDYGETEGRPFIAMEYIEGGSLDKQLTDSPMPLAQALQVILPVTKALHYAHRRGVIHRDLKPGNILLGSDTWPLLADFGLAKLSKEWKEELLTQQGTILGTPAYVAPEQVRGAELDNRADIYSMGVILFRIMTGQLPFDSPNTNRILMAHVNETPPKPSEINPKCPEALEKIILRALKKSPEDRYQSMTEMHIDLEKILEEANKKPVDPLSANPGSTLLMDGENTQAMRQFIRRNMATETYQTLKTGRIYLPLSSVTLDLPDKSRIIIGRSHRQMTADVDLGPYGAASVGVSRQHAILLRRRGRWMIDDLKSRNGTFVNDIQVNSGTPVPLKHEDEVRCSHFVLKFLLE